MRYAKALVAIAGAVLVALQQALADDTFVASDWIAVAVALITAVGVYAVPNQQTSA